MKNSTQIEPPHCTVATVVERQNKYLLVFEERNGKMTYNQPAGHLEPGESLLEAAVRETLEETAWEVQLKAYMGVSTYTAPANGITYVRHSFAAKPLSLDPYRTLDKGIVEARWMDLTEIDEIRDQLASPLVYQDIARHRQAKLFPLELVQAWPVTRTD